MITPGLQPVRADPAPTHLAQFYDDGAFPVESVGDFLASGLLAGDSVVVIAAAEHRDSIYARLAQLSTAWGDLEGSGRLLLLDAEAVLGQFMSGNVPDPQRADAVLGLVLDQAAASAPSGRGRAFGEMVALLNAQNNYAAAIELERIWNGLLRTRPFRLYCAYPIKQFADPAAGSFFRHVCDEHDEIVPVLTWLDQHEGQGRWLAILQQQAHALQLEVAERKKAEAELSASREQLRALASHLQSAREEERARLARDLHDELGQTLTVMKMALKRWTRRLEQADPSPTTAAILAEAPELTQLADDAFQFTRRVLAELRSDMLDLMGLVPALESQAQEFQKRTGIETVFAAECGIELDPARALALFRIMQESLTNVVRHAQATRVHVSLRCQAPNLVLEIRDNGRGLPAEATPHGHLGIIGMRERALLLGGTLEMRGAAGQGTTVVVSIPA